MQGLTSCYGLALGPVLLQVDRHIEVVDELIHAPKAEQELGCHVDPDVYALGNKCEFQAELIPEKLELFMLDVLVELHQILP